MTPIRKCRPRCSRQRGVSLVEIMVGLALGLVIIGALVVMLANTSRARNELAKTSQQIENGRYAMQLLVQDIHHAGFYGDYYAGGSIGAVPTDACDVSTTTSMTNALQYPVQGINNAGGWGTWSCSGSLAPCPSGSSSCSDILAVRRVAADAVCASGDVVTNQYYVQADATTAYVQRGRSAGAFIFGTKDATGANSTLCKFVGHADHACSPPLPAAGVTIPANAAGLACENMTAATIHQYTPHVYFIGANNNDSPADGIPTLKRMTLGTSGFTVEPLVEGIENMQVEYGIDTTSDSSAAPSTYVSTPTAAQWPNVVAVRVHLLARNMQATAGYTDTKTYTLGGTAVGPFNDAYKRHVFSATISLNNIVGRKTLP